MWKNFWVFHENSKRVNVKISFVNLSRVILLSKNTEIIFVARILFWTIHSTECDEFFFLLIYRQTRLEFEKVERKYIN